MRVRSLRVAGVLAAGLVAVAGCSSASVSTGSGSTTANGGGTTVAPTTGAGGQPSGGGPSGGGTQPTGGAGTTTATGVAECRTDQLSVARDTSGGAAAGSVYFGIIFTNTASTPCVMQGFPGVSYTNGPDGDPIGNPAARDNTRAVTPVRLDPGGKATALTRSANGQSGYSTADCKPVQVQGFRIYPPDNKASLFISSPMTECSSPTLTVMSVQAVQPGAAHW
ncbi:DUF4232 domain-containing protein [Nocardia sp. NBC_00511]|uniref:DUF4232 domain-containing protein n=1 Tax=Nocardia sp. NBC_00511 TaxID=2903591 RepID=UPI0030E0FFE8